MNKCFLTAILGLCLASCQTKLEERAVSLVSAYVVDSNASVIGEARLVFLGDALALSLSLHSAPEGRFNVSLLAAGECDVLFSDAKSFPEEDAKQLPKIRVNELGIGSMSTVLEVPIGQSNPGLTNAELTTVLVHGQPNDRNDLVGCGSFNRV